MRRLICQAMSAAIDEGGAAGDDEVAPTRAEVADVAGEEDGERALEGDAAVARSRVWRISCWESVTGETA